MSIPCKKAKCLRERFLPSQVVARGVTLHLRVGPGKPPRNFAEAFHWLDPVGAPNLKLAVETAMLSDKLPEKDMPAWLKGRLGIWLVAAPQSDIAGKVWDTHAPLHSMPDPKATAQWLSAFPAAPKILDAVFETQDEEYLDAVALKRILKER